jgi:hypothetical protein
MNRKRFLIPLITLFALLFASSTAAQEENSIDASLSVIPGEYTVGDPIMLEMTINHPADSHVIIPELESEWGQFIVQSQSAPESNTNENGSKSTSQRLDVRLFAPGEYTTPLIPFTVVTADGQLLDATIDPVPVSISSVLVEGDEALRDIKPQAELPYLFILPWLIAAAVLAVGAVIAIWMIRRRRAVLAASDVDPRLPYEVALDRLDRIESLNLPNDGRFKEHYTMVSDCIRIYVERAFEIPVMERTTSEIQKSILRTPISPPISREFLGLLDESDLVKFSKFAPDAASAMQALVTGRHIVMETKPANDMESVSGSSGTQINSVDEVTEPSVSVNGNMRQTEVRA